MQELLNIEQFCQKKFNKIKINEIETNYWYCWKVLDEWWFLRGGDFIILSPKVVEILNFESFLSLKIILNFKNSFFHNWALLSLGRVYTWVLEQ
jgi:hypothetical protein